jgi:lysozyme family protein
MANFEEAMNIVIQHEVGDDKEGGYTNDPRDPGGETKWGISKKAYPELNIAALSREEAEEIYRSKYWIPNRYNEINDQSLANKLFDLSVNWGAKIVNITIQHAYCIYANSAGSATIAADGIVGNATIAALNNLNTTQTEMLMFVFCCFMAEHYNNLPTSKYYLHGWLNRLFDGVIC